MLAFLENLGGTSSAQAASNALCLRDTQRDRSRIGTKTSHFRDQEMIP